MSLSENNFFLFIDHTEYLKGGPTPPIRTTPVQQTAVNDIDDDFDKESFNQLALYCLKSFRGRGYHYFIEKLHRETYISHGKLRQFGSTKICTIPHFAGKLSMWLSLVDSRVSCDYLAQKRRHKLLRIIFRNQETFKKF